MLAGEYCNRDVVIVGKHESIFKAAQLMRQHHVGDVLVVEPRNGERVPIGILTDRDIVVELVAEGEPLDTVTIEDVMSFKLISSNEKDDLMVTIKKMRINGTRRIPILNQAGGLVGVLSINDILDLIVEQLLDLDEIIANENARESHVRHTPSRH